MKCLIDLSDPDVRALRRIANRRGLALARVIQIAIAEYLHRRRASWIDEVLGLWGADGVDGLDYQRRLRAEW